MDELTCFRCGAPLRPAARVCRTCDADVVEVDSGRLSVAEPVAVTGGLRWVGPLVAVVVLAVVAGAAYGALHLVRDRKVASTTQAADSARHGLELVVRAEGGTPRACRQSAEYLAGVTRGLRSECLAVVGSDPGAHLEDVAVGTPHLRSQTGTVEVRATVVDARGTHTFDRTIHLVDQGGRWRMSWDGHPEV